MEKSTAAAAAPTTDAAPQHARHCDSSHGNEHSKPHVTWDEETIAEHDLLRGTRQKIEEPNTPYHYYDHEADDAGVAKSPVSPARSLSGKESGAEPSIEVRAYANVAGATNADVADAALLGGIWLVYVRTTQWDELRSKLQSVQQQDHKMSEWDNSSGDEDDERFAARDAEGKKLAKDPKFAEKRKMHYNEFERVKAWRQSHPSDDEEDDDEDGESHAHDTSVKRDAHAADAE